MFICLFGVLRHFQHCTGHITTGSWKGRGNQYIQFARVLYYKLPTNGKQLPAFPLTAMTGIKPRPQRWEARVLPLCHSLNMYYVLNFFQNSGYYKKIYLLKPMLIFYVSLPCYLQLLYTEVMTLRYFFVFNMYIFSVPCEFAYEKFT